ncbi:hypothetical protein FQA39_LY14933 [Lamprigera yunnana]|nr:hypothetical protein FQA39_LY14933 [Lamprigera yunnana]
MKTCYGTAILLSTFLVSHTSPAGNITSSAQINLGESLNALRSSVEREESFLEYQKPSIYEYAQKILGNIIQPKPLVDTISEKEKYGNNGDQFRPLGNAIVNGYEGFSNFLNAAIDLPVETMKQITRKATNYLSLVGAKLIGL